MAQSPAERRRAQRAFQREISRGGRPLRAQGRAYRQARSQQVVPLENHRHIDIPDGRYAYQGLVTVRRSNGEIVQIYSHTQAYDQSNRPTRSEIGRRIAADVERQARENESEVEVLSVVLVHAWIDDEGY